MNEGPKYPTQAHGSIPAFNSYEEEAAFWDTHDFTDFQDETQPVQVRSTRGLTESMQLRLDVEIDRELERFAREQGIGKSTLARQWLTERVRLERQRHAS